uniref:ARAD1D16874p n=1 Tax=Blastobotrys adeninivorans TaxID=409370 RepID=A0A060TA88_BLAAD
MSLIGHTVAVGLWIGYGPGVIRGWSISPAYIRKQADSDSTGSGLPVEIPMENQCNSYLSFVQSLVHSFIRSFTDPQAPFYRTSVTLGQWLANCKTGQQLRLYDQTHQTDLTAPIDNHEIQRLD